MTEPHSEIGIRKGRVSQIGKLSAPYQNTGENEIVSDCPSSIPSDGHQEGDTQLMAVIAAWPRLSESVRALIAAAALAGTQAMD